MVRWPGRIEAGSTCTVPVTSPDFYPTLLEMAGLDPIPEHHCDGVSIAPLLNGEPSIDREAIFWHYPHYNRHPQNFPAGVIRSGDWKLMQAFETGEVSLFNLKEDIGETTNLAAKQPKLAKRMLAKLKRWQQEVGADPMRINPEYQSK